jgi:hypothetical protein
MQIIVHKAKKGYIKNDTSDVSKMNSDISKMTHRYIKNDTSNIRLYSDYTMIKENINNKGIESPNKEKIREWIKTKRLTS